MQCYQYKSKGQSWQSCSVEMKIFPFCLAWENSQHFTMPPKVSPWNDVWETSTEIPYWWCITTQIWVVLLTGWSKFYQQYDQSEALPRSWLWRIISMELLHSFLRRNFVGGKGGGGGSLGVDFRKSRGKGRHMASPFCRGGMDIFWNHTVLWSAAAVWYQ